VETSGESQGRTETAADRQSPGHLDDRDHPLPGGQSRPARTGRPAAARATRPGKWGWSGG